MAGLSAKYRCLAAASRVVPVLPRHAAYRLADAAASLAYRLNHAGREAVHANLRHVLGRQATLVELHRFGREVFRTSARNYVDLFALRRLSPADLDPLIRRHGSERLDDAVASGRGVIVVSAHFGNPEVLGLVPREWPVELTVLVEPLDPPELLELYARLRAVKHVRFVAVSPGALLDTVRRLKRGELLGLAVDRNVVGEGARLPFFGGETTLPTGAAALAVRTGALVLPAFGVRSQDRYDLYLEPPFEASRTGDNAADVRATALRILGIVERFIRRWPGQWTVFEPVWQPEAA